MKKEDFIRGGTATEPMLDFLAECLKIRHLHLCGRRHQLRKDHAGGMASDNHTGQ
jgi:hypothetical protein